MLETPDAKIETPEIFETTKEARASADVSGWMSRGGRALLANGDGATRARSCKKPIAASRVAEEINRCRDDTHALLIV